MLASDQVASRIPQWARALLVGCLVVLATGAGLLAWRAYTQPRTMTLAAGSHDGVAVRLMSAIAAQVSKAGSPIRLEIVDSGSTFEAARTFAAGKVDLAIVRADASDLSDARTVVLVTYGVVLVIVPPGSAIESIDDLSGKTVGVVGGEANRRVVDVLTREYDRAGAKVHFRDLQVAEAPKALQSKQVGALLVVTPVSEKHVAALRGLLPAGSKRKPGLVAIDSAEAIANLSRAYESYDLPKGTLRGSPPIPDEDLTTLRVPFYLVANKRLDTDAVTDLTRAVMDARRELLAEHPMLAQIAAPSTDKDAFIPVHPGAAAFYDDSQQGFLDKYSDAFYYIPMLLGVLASFATAAWRFIRSDASQARADPLALLHSLAVPIRQAQSESELQALEERIDDVVQAALAPHEKGTVRATDLAALSLVTQRLDHAISSRRSRLAAG